MIKIPNITSTIGYVSVLATSSIIVIWLNRILTTPSNTKKLLEKKKKGKLANFNDIPGIVGYPLVGVMFDLLPYVRRKRMDLYVQKLIEQFDGIFRMYIDRQTLFTDDAAITKQILNNPEIIIRNATLEELTFDFSPSALFALPSGDTWKKHRKGLQPAFSPVHLRESFSVSLEFADKLLDIWSSALKNGQKTRNVMEDFTMLTGDVISKIAFSSDLGALKALETRKGNDFHHHMEIIASTIETRLSLRISKYLWHLYGVSSSAIKPTVKYIRELLRETIAQKQLKPREKKDGNFDLDLLDRLLGSSGTVHFSDNEIMDELFGFFLAGHETTANTLTWATLELVEQPRVFKKLREEIREIVGVDKITLESLSSLKYLHFLFSEPKLSLNRYLDAFIKETMRIHSVINFISRETIKKCEVTMSNGMKIMLPAGVQIISSINQIHRKKEHWGEDANEFKPERWINNDGTSFIPVAGSYVPFGDGQMMCIGQKMALIETKVMLIRMIQRFDLSLSNEQGPLEPVNTLTFGLKNGLLIDIHDFN
ncbi:hypothetical protein HK096_003833 [Nowakowskiella sp. JEL0078]|nr:hypothetical protein HK096_003833 [Nowakowskiella sp. JEL0078]